MKTAAFRFLPAILSISASVCDSCSTVQPVRPSLFLGHSIGEGSGTWASEEPNQDIDPLFKCQQMVRSPLLEQSLESTQRCREFVDHGSYQIDLRGFDGSHEKIFRFKNWRLSLIAARFGNAERSRVLADLDARFANSVSGKLWYDKQGNSIEILPVEQLEMFTGRSSNDTDGLLVVVSGGG